MAKRVNSEETDKLISDVRRGDEKAFSELLCRYTPLIEASVRKCLSGELYDAHAEDFRQEATVVFYNSILAYDIEQYEVEFGLYAKICITNALISQLRLLQKRNAERPTETPEKECLAVNDSPEPSDRIVAEESLSLLYSVIRNNLSEFEYDVWQHYMSGMSAAQIGAKVGREARAVENAVYRIRKKLRALLH